MESRDPLAFGQFMLVIFSCLPKTFTTLEENCTADLGLYFLNFFFFFESGTHYVALVVIEFPV